MPYDALLKGRISLTGHYYIATTVTADRHPLFDSFAHGRMAINAMRTQDLAGHTQTLACVVMPDHVHWLVQLTKLTLSEVVRRFKGCVAIEVNRLRGRSGPVWQRGFHDHAVRSDESLERIARYIIENPVRAGLVAGIGEYSLWHSMWDL
ncbi:MAG TPA: transposase [Povalibacter sp.]|uniref:REP-associated tyrosine transposase n=1 Tax=Povalibacter sp. TaxID=1962978 RepID=UPI002BC8E6E9|nr:transposase [Povalibacter sp.]HMN46631.1 transposase [Povalibacter sp.]